MKVERGRAKEKLKVLPSNLKTMFSLFMRRQKNKIKVKTRMPKRLKIP